MVIPKGTSTLCVAESTFCSTSLIFDVDLWRCCVSERAALRYCVDGQDAQDVGGGDRRVRGDAGRALEGRAARGVRVL